MTANEVLVRLTEHANASIEPFLFQQGDVISFDLTNNDAKAKLHLIKRVKMKRRTGGEGDKAWEEIEIELELHDPQAALVQLGRYHKLFTDRTELEFGQLNAILNALPAELREDVKRAIAEQLQS